MNISSKYFLHILSLILLDPEEQKGHQVPVFVCAGVALQTCPLSLFYSGGRFFVFVTVQLTAENAEIAEVVRE
ncbi:MAG: hypothetical protein A2545_07985 [Planctomycetes bacterium RIFOXYD2_FULL_41_16]|nr:MAG: hypothetical protein A3J92_05985 [Planctomycetes bacterium RIFOXYC2_FULL_41_27]OHC07596.1 MAG: hypothetical protein A2545_07985 [Planctomycetes bacterium RIFOXYD2_FULL_41_16]